MIIQNRLEAATYSVFLRIIISLNILLIVMLFVLLAPFDLFLTKIMLGITLLTYLAFLIRMPHFLNYSDGDINFITIRYYNIHPLLAHPKQLKLPKGVIHEVKIKSYFWGWRKMLYISVKTKTDIAKFKPINISLLKKDKANRLKKQISVWKAQ